MNSCEPMSQVRSDFIASHSLGSANCIPAHAFSHQCLDCATSSPLQPRQKQLPPNFPNLNFNSSLTPSNPPYLFPSAAPGHQSSDAPCQQNYIPSLLPINTTSHFLEMTSRHFIPEVHPVQHSSFSNQPSIFVSMQEQFYTYPGTQTYPMPDYCQYPREASSQPHNSLYQDSKGRWWSYPSPGSVPLDRLCSPISGCPAQSWIGKDAFPTESPRKIHPSSAYSWRHQVSSYVSVANVYGGISLPSASSRRLSRNVMAPRMMRSQSTPQRHYSPEPSVDRTEWVMWVGNIPSDSTRNELWRFFNGRIPKNADGLDNDHSSELRDQRQSLVASKPTSGDPWGGVQSVFLMSHSNCAFINFESEYHLITAVADFDGKRLRPHVANCMKLVCRIRKTDDDLRAGVGIQRGMGLHTNWVKDKKARSMTFFSGACEGDLPARCSRSLDMLFPRATSDQDDWSASSTLSCDSEESGFYEKYFRTRYFILKSSNEANLKRSVERGMWATQAHNVRVLDQAYRTSDDVYLIFSANRSGEFFGYARMSGAIKPGGADIQAIWNPVEEMHNETQEDSDSYQQQEPLASKVSLANEKEHQASAVAIDMPNRLVMSPSDTEITGLGELRMASFTTRFPEHHNPHNSPPLTRRHSFPLTLRTVHAEKVRNHGKPLYDAEAGNVVIERENSDNTLVALPTLSSNSSEEEAGIALVKDKLAVGTVTDNVDDGGDGTLPKERWGAPFTVDWIRTERLSFEHTKHLKNPWNRDREVKVSRDGIELEPGIGASLLEQWNSLPRWSPNLIRHTRSN